MSISNTSVSPTLLPLKNHKKKEFHIIGIGASAGGLEALKMFFNYVPSSFEHTLIIIQHLSPDHKSLMKELLEKNTSLPILSVTNNMTVKKGYVYLIPPGKNMVLKDKKLHLFNKPAKKKLNLPINIFFNSLALEEKEDAIAILLSGTGSDGTLGAREIHENGGVVLAQNPEEAKFNGMPLSVINSGVVDFVLSASSMSTTVLNLINEDGKSIVEQEIERNPQLVDKLLNHIYNITNFDFKSFKSPTLIRRISKRISLGGFTSFSNYFKYLLENKKEVLLLEKEFLISVTEFYRDSEVWSHLKLKVLPTILGAKKKKENFKVWSVGCSTGQEPYSIADMVYEELVQQNKLDLVVKIFASDASSSNIHTASKGIYSQEHIKNLSQEQVERMFTPVDDKFLIKEHLRQMVVFSPHNILSDPPFGKMDMVFCRNLLIYMNKESQTNIISTLQYSLKLGGILVMGKSESIGPNKDFFEELSASNRLFKNLKISKSLFAQKLSLEGNLTKKNKQPILGFNGSTSSSFAKYELVEMLNKCLPDVLDLSFMLVDQNQKIIDAVGNFSKYLQMPKHGFSTNLFDLLPEHMKSPLNIGFNKALKTSQKVKVEALQINSPKDKLVTDIIVFPNTALVDSPMQKYLLVFMPRKQELKDTLVVKGLSNSTKNEHIVHLENELKDARHNLLRLQHELEIRNEELQTSNEELLATNEELQSTNEELQSVNEELYTVNAELNQKLQDLAEANAHINNILQSSNVDTLFLDQSLNIRKFTPGILNHFNISLKDIGRPLKAFTNNFGSFADNLLKNAQKVIETGEAEEREIKDLNGNWFLKRISPYFHSKHMISGVVITFVDISNLKKAESAVKFSENKYRDLYENAPDMFVTISVKGVITNCNQKMIDTLGYESQKDLVGKSFAVLLPEKWQEKSKKEFKFLLSKHKLSNVFREIYKKNGELLPIHVNVKTLYNEDNTIKEFISSWRDVSEIQKTQQQLKDKNIAYEQVIENTMAGFWDWNIPNHTEYLSPSFKKMFGYENDEMENSPDAWQKIIHPDDLPGVLATFNKHVESKGKVPFDNEVRYYHKQGHIVWVWCKGKVIEWDQNQQPIRMVGSHVDITKLKNYHQQLQSSNKQLERFAYLASHDLQEPLRTINDFTTLLQKEYEEVHDDNAETYINYIVQASNRMGLLVKSILEYSKIGKKENFEYVNLNNIISNAENDLIIKIKDKKAKIIVEELPVVWANPIELHSLFLNLIGNALKFIHKDRTPIVRIYPTTNHGLPQINIEDNGIGISPEDTDKVFEVFKRLHNSDDYEGTGIGLAHCKKIVESHNGHIGVSANKDVGSTFYFTINTNKNTNDK